MAWLTLVLTVSVLPFLSNAAPDWDFFMFTQAWPPAVCIEGEGHHTCKIPNDVKTWTVHGLWPTKRGTEGPTDCNSSWPFNEDDIKTLEPQMRKTWPNLYVDTEEKDFWKHEWEKHGTCGTSVPSVANEFLYFQKGLNLNQQYDIMGILADKGIVPDEHATYQPKMVLDALKAELGITPKVECAYDQKMRNHVLYEVELCLDKNFNMVDCLTGSPGSVGRFSRHHSHHHESSGNQHSGEHSSYSNCPNDGFLYPPLPTMSVHVV